MAVAVAVEVLAGSVGSAVAVDIYWADIGMEGVLAVVGLALVVEVKAGACTAGECKMAEAADWETVGFLEVVDRKAGSDKVAGGMAG